MSPLDDLSCPLCGARAAGAPAECPNCAAPLAGYWRAVFRPWLHYNRAVGLAAEGRNQAAARAAAAAVALDPTCVELRLLLAGLLAALGEVDEAIEQAELAADARPDSEEAERLLETLFDSKFSQEQRERARDAPDDPNRVKDNPPGGSHG